MSANLYDLLDVEESASADEIRAAWKAAIAELDPGDRRFRAYSDAAAVLLDDAKRAESDAELAAERAREEEQRAAEAAAAAETTRLEKSAATPAPSAAVAASDTLAGPVGEEAAADAPREEPTPERTSRFSRPPSGALVGAIGVVAVLALALSIWVGTLPGTWPASDSPRAAAARGAEVERAGLSAEGAAEQMVGPVLSYNHQTMAADLDRLRGYLTDEMAAKQTKAWPELTTEAQAQQIVVQASVTGTALTRVSKDGDRATVVVFIDQAVTKKGAQPFTLNMWATMELVRSAKGPQGWLLADLCTDASCGA
ncbi:J domain-containing protein [Nocardioides sp.]|uniref:J domain-containing protein n=1 Tax=Nocardioides sp. TaxID=35761 RepID=UPI00351224F1